jgi:hypothetical protein
MKPVIYVVKDKDVFALFRVNHSLAGPGKGRGVQHQKPGITHLSGKKLV